MPLNLLTTLFAALVLLIISIFTVFSLAPKTRTWLTFRGAYIGGLILERNLLKCVAGLIFREAYTQGAYIQDLTVSGH